MGRYATVSISVEIEDMGAAFDAAEAALSEAGCDEESIKQFIGTKTEPDDSNVIRTLIDPSVSPAGLQILDSSCEMDPEEDEAAEG